MDPTTNPTPTPNPAPAPGAAPAPEVAPTAPEASAAPAAPVAPEPATPEPVAPVAPEPVAPVVPGPAPTVGSAAGGMTTPPVNPIIQPGANTDGAAAQPEGLVAATDPIMMPEPAKAPDPVEEELKAPMKAAAPVPGSIGSAVSGAPTAPANNPFADNGKQTPSVAFNDPATQTNPAAPAKKKTNKVTLIVLIVIAAVIIIALAVILIMQLTAGNSNNNSTSTANTTPNSEVVIDEGKTTPQEEASSSATVATTGALSCTRNMTTEEVARVNGAVSGTVNVSAEFDDTTNLLSKISLVESVTYNDSSAASNEPVENAVHEALASDLTTASASIYYLPVVNGALDLAKTAIQANYESLEFTCEVL